MGRAMIRLNPVQIALAIAVVLTLGGCKGDDSGRLIDSEETSSSVSEAIENTEEVDVAIATESRVSMELVQNGSFSEWTEDGMPLSWQVRPGRIERVSQGEDAAVLLVPNSDPAAPRWGTLRYKISLPEDAAGKELQMSLEVLAPDGRVSFNISAEGLGKIITHNCRSDTDFYTYNEASALLPEGVGSVLWLVISVPIEVADGAIIDDVSVKLISD